MDPELEAFEVARQDRDRRTAGEARDLATAYVTSHPELEGRYAKFGIERLVQLVDAARDRGDTETVAEIDAWLMARHEPQRIGGTFHLGGQ